MFARFVPRLVEMGADDVTVAIRHEWVHCIIEAKEHDPIAGRHISNFAQGFSHQPLIYAAGVIENEGIKRRPEARQSSTDSRD